MKPKDLLRELEQGERIAKDVKSFLGGSSIVVGTDVISATGLAYAQAQMYAPVPPPTPEYPTQWPTISTPTSSFPAYYVPGY